MLGSGKDVLGVVGISWDEVGAGTFPDTDLPGQENIGLDLWDIINPTVSGNVPAPTSF